MSANLTILPSDSPPPKYPNEVRIAYARLRTEEGKRPRAYNDATGKTVTCLPEGNLTIAFGTNLEDGLDNEEQDWLLEHRLGIAYAESSRFGWYAALNDVRASVILDLVYNDGLGHLLHFPHMLAAISVSDWPRAKDELLNSDAARELESRYVPLATLLYRGTL